MHGAAVHKKNQTWI